MLEPGFIRKLKASSIKNVLLVGCGGGFDFVHTMLLYPTLKELDMNIFIGSYSFGLIEKLPEEAEDLFHAGDSEIKIVTGKLKGDQHYAPEINLCKYLDKTYPDEDHFIYTYYARDFTVGKLSKAYQHFCDIHHIDCVIAFDGGSDSLMTGDEAGVGDVVEDLVSLTAISGLTGPKEKLLFTVGMGSDRYNDVSDASSLRAVSELIRTDGFLGSISVEKSSRDYQFYKECIKFIYTQQTFHSTVSGFIISSIEGYFGNKTVPEILRRSLKEDGNFFIWPLMGMLWSFDIDVVVSRSLIPEAIKNKETVAKTWSAVTELRQSILDEILDVENMPGHEEMRSAERFNFTTGSLEGGIFDEVEEL